MSTWRGVADAYQASFATLCDGTIERLLSDTPGDKHLDVGCGTGALAARAAVMGRTVVALDADREMVAMSKDALSGCVLEASLPDLPFGDATFDSVTANFVINHVGDPRAAMRELARVTRPRGRVAVTTWPAPPPEWALLVGKAFNRAGVVPIASRRLGVGMDFERSARGLTELADASGLQPLTATDLTWDWEISANALWEGIAGGVATVGQIFLAQAPEVQASAEREFHDAAAALAVNGVLTLSSTAAYLVATA